ncbi:hypothetical protein CP97_11570 [Aurantiacibacter atlanticus]|uniref:Uncharacterized protein n=1 Tax=Aurantiacibacter atlanticus TaxID=1648404 RepID=A0A0H4VZA2_9SPHN|nr:hypothetical protein [Aurantiacibacter atlanticus]AKQ42533.2 hypothetical protein CP97_11570 [Aurantiacibacter atlanticus]
MAAAGQFRQTYSIDAYDPPTTLDVFQGKGRWFASIASIGPFGLVDGGIARTQTCREKDR